MSMLKTIDAHAEGGPLRLVVDGFPTPRGTTMADKLEWARRHADGLRRLLMLEPRGHADMCGAMLTEPVSPGSHAGVIFMNGEGYTAMSGHGIIAVTTIALERGLLMAGGDGLAVTFDTAAGSVRARATRGSRPVERVSVVNVPSFVMQAGVLVKAAGRRVRADVAFGGAFYAIVDSEGVGLSVDSSHVPELRRTGIEITRAVAAAQAIAHPLEPRVEGLAGTIFTAPPRAADAALRNVTVFSGGQIDRSPGGTGTAAVMSVLDAMGLIGEGQRFVHEGLIDTRIVARVVSRTSVGAYDAIIAEMEGSAWITGEHTFVDSPDDPLREGCRV